jgi:hypothetical protein
VVTCEQEGLSLDCFSSALEQITDSDDNDSCFDPFDRDISLDDQQLDNEPDIILTKQPRNIVLHNPKVHSYNPINNHVSLFKLQSPLLQYILLFTYKNTTLKSYLQSFVVSKRWFFEMKMLAKIYNHHFTLKDSFLFSPAMIMSLAIQHTTRIDQLNIKQMWYHIQQYGFLFEDITLTFTEDDQNYNFIKKTLLSLTEDVTQFVEHKEENAELIATSRLKHLKVHATEFNLETCIPASFYDQLETLHFQMPDNKFKSKEWKFLVEFPILRELTIIIRYIGTSFATYIGECIHLESLTLSIGEILDEGGLTDQIINWPNSLKYLKITSKKLLKFLLEHVRIPQLYTLLTKNNIEFKSPNWSFAFPNLHKIYVYGNTNVLTAFYQCPNLVELNIVTHQFFHSVPKRRQRSIEMCARAGVTIVQNHDDRYDGQNWIKFVLTIPRDMFQLRTRT